MNTWSTSIPVNAGCLFAKGYSISTKVTRLRFTQVSRLCHRENADPPPLGSDIEQNSTSRRVFQRRTSHALAMAGPLFLPPLPGYSFDIASSTPYPLRRGWFLAGCCQQGLRAGAFKLPLGPVSCPQIVVPPLSLFLIPGWSFKATIGPVVAACIR